MPGGWGCPPPLGTTTASMGTASRRAGHSSLSVPAATLWELGDVCLPEQSPGPFQRGMGAGASPPARLHLEWDRRGRWLTHRPLSQGYRTGAKATSSSACPSHPWRPPPAPPSALRLSWRCLLRAPLSPLPQHPSATPLLELGPGQHPGGPRGKGGWGADWSTTGSLGAGPGPTPLGRQGPPGEGPGAALLAARADQDESEALPGWAASPQTLSGRWRQNVSHFAGGATKARHQRQALRPCQPHTQPGVVPRSWPLWAEACASPSLCPDRAGSPTPPPTVPADPAWGQGFSIPDLDLGPRQVLVGRAASMGPASRVGGPQAPRPRLVPGPLGPEMWLECAASPPPPPSMSPSPCPHFCSKYSSHCHPHRASGKQAPAPLPARLQRPHERGVRGRKTQPRVPSCDTHGPRPVLPGLAPGLDQAVQVEAEA